MIFLPIIALLCAPALFLVFGRPRFSREGRSVEGGFTISIIIPARDEVENLGVLLPSIFGQGFRSFEVIVADDGSTDGTVGLAESLGARVISCPPLPAGWMGKPWACHQAAQVATGDFLLFLDADTFLSDGGLEKIGAMAVEGTAFSWCPFHVTRRAYEQLSAFFNLTTVCGVNAFSVFSGSSAMFGQSVLVHRGDYERVGGHEAVAGEVLENFQLAGRLREGGMAVEALLGAGVVGMRMFPEGFSQLWSSWKKGASRGARESDKRALVITSVWVTGAMLCLTALVIAVMPGAGGAFRWWAAAAYGVYAGQCFLALRKIGRFSLFTSVFFPVPLMFYQTVFFTSLIGARVRVKNKWKGRDVD